MEKYEVEMTITKTYTVKVTVEGEFGGPYDPEVEEAAKQDADNMSHDEWEYKETEFEVNYINRLF